MKKISFIGAGNMGGAMIKGVCKVLDARQVIIYDVDSAKTSELKNSCGCVVADSLMQACDSEYIVLAVKPQVLRNVQRDINPYLVSHSEKGERQVIISIAAGITLESLAATPKQAGLDLPVVRMLPNTPCEVGQGLMIYCVNSLADKNITDEVNHIFSQCGTVELVDENMLDVASAVSGCTPAFAYMFIEALADGAVRCGVPRDKAIRYAAQAVAGSAHMVLETGRHPDVLKDAVCSPGGSTIVGVSTLENSAFRAAAANAVFYANEKNKDLGK